MEFLFVGCFHGRGKAMLYLYKCGLGHTLHLLSSILCLSAKEHQRNHSFKEFIITKQILAKIMNYDLILYGKKL